MSKSGLFAHFGSKQKLQLATIERAKEIFDQAVLQPAGETTVGTERLWRLCDVWLWHLEDRVFPSGYFFTGAFLEYGPRQGPLASSLQQIAMIWMKSIERSVQQAQDKKELRSEPSAERMAFELNAMLVGAYWARLAGYGDAYSTARVTILSRLRSGATHRIPSDAFKSVNTWRRYLRAHVKRSSGK